LRQMDEEQYEMYMKNLGLKIDILDFLMEIFTMFTDLIKNPAYRSDWVSMINIQNQTFIHAIKIFAKTLSKKFLDEASFDFSLWSSFFDLGVAFLTQDSIQIEKLSVNRRQLIKSREGKQRDLRCEMGFQIRNMWFNLGQHKIKFIPHLVGNILEMTLIPENELRKVTIPIFFDMMQCELHSAGNFKQFENEMITKLDVQVEAGKGDRNYQKVFYDIMSDWCKKHQFLKSSGLEFVKLVCNLFSRLLDYREIIAENNRDNRMSCTVNLLNFYKEINRSEMYVRYLHKLAYLHEQSDNYTEAAYTLLQHATLIKWGDEKEVNISYRGFESCNTQSKLKEQIYVKCVEYFERSNMYEMSIELCKELQHQHETKTFDYEELANILMRQATLYREIMKGGRMAPQYFFVGFYGNGYPTFQRNKKFVYRGLSGERLQEFTARLMTKIPGAHKMMSTTPPSDEILNSNDMHVQIYNVNPVMETPSHFKGKSIDENIISFYENNEIQKFSYNRPFRKGPKGENEFANLWLERSIFKLTNKLPGILRWFEVVSTHTTELSPLENALEQMSNSNNELTNLVLEHTKNPHIDLKPITLKLKGMVDPMVMGGWANYEKAFFVDSYLEKHPEDANKISKLKDLIASQIPILEEGLKFHGEHVGKDLLPLHDAMMETFNQLKLQTVNKYGAKPPMIKRENEGTIPVVRKMSKPRPESIISITSNISYTGVNNDASNPPEIPSKIKSSQQNIPANLYRSTSVISSHSIDSGVVKRKSKPSDWFSNNFGGSTASLQDKQPPPAIELKEELTPARPRRPKSRTDFGQIMQQRPFPANAHKKAPPLPMKATGDFLPSNNVHSNNDQDDIWRRKEPPSPLNKHKKPMPPPIPLKRHESGSTPPRKPFRQAKSPK